MRKYTKLKPTFKNEIMITETGDPGHADNINAGPIQIFENTIANKEEIEKGDSKDRTVTFMSNDSADALSWTDVALMKSGEKHKNLFEKISTMFKNVRFLYRLLGQTDISTIKDGTVTGILNELKQVAFTGIYSDLNNKPLALPASDVYTWAKQAAKPAYSKSEVGLGNVNNTSDKDKPVSTEQQTALDKKVNFADISRSAAVNVAGKKALDAMEKNALIEGTLAHDISQIYSNLPAASWGNVTVNTNVVSNGAIQYQKYGNICIVYFAGNVSTTNVWTDYKLASRLPPVKYGYIPMGIFQHQDTQKAYIATVAQEELYIRTENEPPSGWMRGSITYVCN